MPESGTCPNCGKETIDYAGGDPDDPDHPSDTIWCCMNGRCRVMEFVDPEGW